MKSRFICLILLLVAGFTQADPVWQELDEPTGALQFEDLAFHPTDPDHILITGPFGIYQTTSRGDDWTSLTDGYDPQFFWVGQSIAMSPLNPQLILAGLLLVNGTYGIKRSSDGGQTWQHIYTENGHWDTNDFLFADEQTVWLAANYGLAKSVDQGVTWQFLDEFEGAFSCRIVQPTIGPDTLVVTTGFMTPNPYSPLSFSSDGGNSWHPRQEGLHFAAGVRDIAFHRNFPGTWFIIVDTPPGFEEYQGVYKSTDWGQSWLSVSSGLTSQMWLWQIIMDPTDSNRLLVSDLGSGLYETTNGGQSWHYFATAPLATSTSTLTYSPFDDSTIWMGDSYRTLYLSTDNGQSWQEKDNGISGTYLTTMSGDSDALYAGGLSGTFRSSDLGGSWEFINQNQPWLETTVLAANPLNSSTVYQGGSAYTDGCHFKISYDGGNSWSAMEDGLNMSLRPDILAISPQDTTSIYLAIGSGSQQLYRLDAEQNWEQLPQPDADRYYSMIIDPGDPDRLLAGEFYDGQVYYSSDGAQTWQVFDIHPGERTLTAIDPTDSNILYALGSLAMYRSRDQGETWDVITPDVPSDHPFGLVVHPLFTNRIFCAYRNYGLFWSNDYGDTWQPLNEGLDTWLIRTLFIEQDSNTLFAGTYYDGIYRLDMNTLGVENDPQITFLPALQPN
ncbi:MAG: hypothetical protein B6244_13800, partial [Candidatus Cloacimonetes bacterium 4572_55]